MRAQISEFLIGRDGDAARKRRVIFLVFLLLYLSYAPFLQSFGNPNVVGRLGLSANFAQHASLDIDGYHELTMDKALRLERYYLDKAPGMSILALPAAWILTRIFAITPDAIAPDSPQRLRWAALVYLAVLSTSAFLVAMAGALLFGYVWRTTGNIGAALVGAITYGLGTPTWGWATAFFGHAAAGALLLLGFLAFEAAADTKRARDRTVLLLLGGIALGFAVLVEMTAVIPVLLICAYCARKLVAEVGLLEAARPCSVIVAGGSVAGALLLLYNTAAFGSPLNLGYQHVIGFDGMQSGFLGISVPSLDVLREILIGERRGVLWISPVLALAAAGLVSCVAHAETRRLGLLLAAIVAWYLALNAGYFYWDGGWSTGPRHITPTFPFLALAMALWWRHLGLPGRLVAGSVLAASVLVCLACVSVTMMAPDPIARPLQDLIFPRFLRGELTGTITYQLTRTASFLHTLPLLLSWIAVSWLLWRTTRGAVLARAGAPAG